MTPLIIAVIVLALIFDFLNGIHDSSNVVATMISSRAIPPKAALAMTALANFFGPFIFGVAVANTIGHEIVAADSINTQVLLAALVSAIFWNLLTWYLGFPSSSSHALIGGFIGAVVMAAGWQAIHLAGLEKILIALFASPLIGYVIGYLLLKLIVLLCWNATPRINGLFKRAQVLTALALALSHGTNDAQKTMGIITLALVTGDILTEFAVPVWVIILCAGMIAARHCPGWVEIDPHPGWQVLQDPPAGWLHLPAGLGGGHPRRLAGRRPGQHHPGGQLGHHGRGGG